MDLDRLLIDEQFLPAAQDLISKAQNRIWIATFKVEVVSRPRGRQLYQFLTTLFEKAQAGLDVRFMLNVPDNRNTIPRSNGYAIQTFKQNKIKVRVPRRQRTFHAKIIIVDQEPVILGSHNLSIRSCHNNFEASCMVADKVIGVEVALMYANVWDSAQNV